MSSLGKELQDTIRNLEKLRDSLDSPSDDVLARLDVLYGQQIELIDAAINKSTKEYIEATTAMNEAAKATNAAIDDLAKIEQAIEKVGDAVGKVTAVLEKVV